MYWLPYSSHTSHHPSKTPWLPWISYATQKLILNSRWSKSSLKHSTCVCGIFSKFKNFIAYRSSKVSSCPDCNFEIHQLWQSGFSWVYSSCCCSCWFEAEIIKIGQSSHKMYSNNILNFQESTTILNVCTKNVWKLTECTTYIDVTTLLFFILFTLTIGECNKKKWRKN